MSQCFSSYDDGHLTHKPPIIRIGRNYAEHAKELGNAVPKSPFFFLKPTTSYVDNGGVVEIPKGVDCHFEGEKERLPLVADVDVGLCH
jgi:2-keto-4-pentenoate hydratase/2-oxohepta-3-ene-1,7-dioic acid hydratase in catechol pathway